MKDALNSIRKYCDYVEDHIDNVNKAWKLVQDKCQDLDFMKDQDMVTILHSAIKKHDFTKLSQAEFLPYVMRFYPSEVLKEANSRDCSLFELAWEHHKLFNFHHWQTWTKFKNIKTQKLNCIHMVIDWVAMGFKFNDTAREYYEKNKNEIELPDWAEKLCYEIFDKVYGEKK